MTLDRAQAARPQSANGTSTVVVVAASVGGGLVLIAVTIALVVYANKRTRAMAKRRNLLHLPVHVARPHRPERLSAPLGVVQIALPEGLELEQLGRLRGRVRECMTLMNIHTGRYADDGRPLGRPVLWADVANFQPPPFVSVVEHYMRIYLEQQGHVVLPAPSIQAPPTAVTPRTGTPYMHGRIPRAPRAHEVLIAHGDPYARSGSGESTRSTTSTADSESTVRAPAASSTSSSSSLSSLSSFELSRLSLEGIGLRFGGYVPSRRVSLEESAEESDEESEQEFEEEFEEQSDEGSESSAASHNESVSTLPRYSPLPSYKSEDEVDSGWF